MPMVMQYESAISILLLKRRGVAQTHAKGTHVG